LIVLLNGIEVNGSESNNNRDEREEEGQSEGGRRSREREKEQRDGGREGGAEKAHLVSELELVQLGKALGDGVYFAVKPVDALQRRARNEEAVRSLADPHKALRLLSAWPSLIRRESAGTDQLSPSGYAPVGHLTRDGFG
jgi:hypothetical protein